MIAGFISLKCSKWSWNHRAALQMKGDTKANENASGLTILPWSHRSGPGTGVYCGVWSAVCFHPPSHSRWPTGPDAYSSAGRCNWGREGEHTRAEMRWSYVTPSHTKKKKKEGGGEEKIDYSTESPLKLCKRGLWTSCRCTCDNV